MEAAQVESLLANRATSVSRTMTNLPAAARYGAPNGDRPMHGVRRLMLVLIVESRDAAPYSEISYVDVNMYRTDQLRPQEFEMDKNICAR